MAGTLLVFSCCRRFALAYHDIIGPGHIRKARDLQYNWLVQMFSFKPFIFQDHGRGGWGPLRMLLSIIPR
jgi:hypothetical protein